MNTSDSNKRQAQYLFIFEGLTLKQKIDLVVQRVQEASADIFVVTALDEVACKNSVILVLA